MVRTELDPSRMPLGTIFMWKNQMWRRGKGIIYRARPGAPFLTERWLKRCKKRQKQSGPRRKLR